MSAICQPSSGLTCTALMMMTMVMMAIYDDNDDESSYMRPWCSHRFGEEAMWSSWRIEGTL